MVNQGLEPWIGTPEQLASRMRTDLDKLGTLIKSIGRHERLTTKRATTGATADLSYPARYRPLDCGDASSESPIVE